MNSILENTPGLENRLAGENLPKLTEKITSGILHFITDASPKVHVNPMNVVVKFQIERQQMIEDVLDKLSKTASSGAPIRQGGRPKLQGHSVCQTLPR